jgi:hypothetical protein
MILHVLVDASYLSRSHARSVAGAVLFLRDLLQPTKINGPIHCFSTITPCVVASAGEAEYAALFAGGQQAAIRTILEDLGYPQPPTIILCNNTTTIGIATDSIKQKRSKAIDMKMQRIRDRVHQGHFTITYIPTDENLADYFTKNLDRDTHNKFIPFLVNNMDTPV